MTISNYLRIFVAQTITMIYYSINIEGENIEIGSGWGMIPGFHHFYKFLPEDTLVYNDDNEETELLSDWIVLRLKYKKWADDLNKKIVNEEQRFSRWFNAIYRRNKVSDKDRDITYTPRQQKKHDDWADLISKLESVRRKGLTYEELQKMS